MYRLPAERRTVTVDDLTVEIQSVGAWPIAATADRLVSAFFAADTAEAEFAALRAVYDYFALEAQPSWQIADHRGAIATTGAGMLRLPIELGLGIVREWRATLTPEATAADKVLPDGPAREAVNKALRKRKG